jgi:hypothetical protein
MVKKLLITTFVLALATYNLCDANQNKIYRGYKECFRFMANEQNLFGMNDDSLFKLAAESSIDRYILDSSTAEIVLVIKIAANRGAQDNGDYYLFKVLEDGLKDGYEFIGKLGGSSYKYGTLNGKARFITLWHVSSEKVIEIIYDWDSNIFKCTSKILYQCDAAGNKKKIKDLK